MPSLPRSLVRLVRLHGSALRAILERLSARVFELRAHVRVDEVAVLDSLEPVLLEKRSVLCVQQSSGNSACPEVDLSPTLF